MSREVIFKYPLSLRIAFDSLLLTLTFFIFIGIILLIRDEGGGLILIGGSFLLIMPLYINGKLLLSDIVISDEYIMARLFGVTWKKIYWNDVIDIKIYKLPIVGNRNSQSIFIRTSVENRYFILTSGPIIFSDQINDFKSAMSMLTEISADRQISMIS